MNYPRRILLVVLDGLGIGAVSGKNPDTLAGANTLRNALRMGVELRDYPFLRRLGLFAAAGMECGRAPAGHGWGRTRQLSPYPESYSGHWEMAGFVPVNGFGHPGGLNQEMLGLIQTALDCEVIGNLGCYPFLERVPSSLLAEHHRTRKPILLVQSEVEPITAVGIYADPNVVEREEFFSRVARAATMLGDAPVPGRLIARMFDVVDGAAILRRDRVDSPYFHFRQPTILRGIRDSGRETFATGKVGGLFNGQGFSRCWHGWGSSVIHRNTLRAWAALSTGLLWVNQNDLSRPCGAERDVSGWRQALRQYDMYLAELHGLLEPEDIMIVTGDHGTDPTLTGAHTYEWTPLLVAGASVAGMQLGDRNHIDIAATIAEVWKCGHGGDGKPWPAALWNG